MSNRIPATALAREGDRYIVSCPGYWGRGDTIEEAKKNLPYSFDADGWILYSVHPTTFIDDDGRLNYPLDHKPIEINACASIKKRWKRDGYTIPSERA